MSKKSKQVRIITMYNIKNTKADLSTSSPRSQQQQELNSGDNNSNKQKKHCRHGSCSSETASPKSLPKGGACPARATPTPGGPGLPPSCFA
mmetsp:Transcript_30722/g.48339  ORF Transcript_30722/g.48339 Transcript_30722/m.48339 type:complete len:91 (+) Transcript_30722:80-352(+)